MVFLGFTAADRARDLPDHRAGAHAGGGDPGQPARLHGPGQAPGRLRSRVLRPARHQRGREGPLGRVPGPASRTGPPRPPTTSSSYSLDVLGVLVTLIIILVACIYMLLDAPRIAASPSGIGGPPTAAFLRRTERTLTEYMKAQLLVSLDHRHQRGDRAVGLRGDRALPAGGDLRGGVRRLGLRDGVRPLRRARSWAPCRRSCWPSSPPDRGPLGGGGLRRDPPARRATSWCPTSWASAVGVHPLVVIFGLLIGEQLAGIVGVLIAIPMVVIVKEAVMFAIERLGLGVEPPVADAAPPSRSPNPRHPGPRQPSPKRPRPRGAGDPRGSPPGARTPPSRGPGPERPATEPARRCWWRAAWAAATAACRRCSDVDLSSGAASRWPCSAPTARARPRSSRSWPAWGAPSSGTLAWAEDVAPRVGWVPQRPALYQRLSAAREPAPVRGARGRGDPAAAADALIARADLGALADPIAARLSTGTLQRLNLAIALAGAPQRAAARRAHRHAQPGPAPAPVGVARRAARRRGHGGAVLDPVGGRGAAARRPPGGAGGGPPGVRGHPRGDARRPRHRRAGAAPRSAERAFMRLVAPESRSAVRAAALSSGRTCACCGAPRPCCCSLVGLPDLVALLVAVALQSHDRRPSVAVVNLDRSGRTVEVGGRRLSVDDYVSRLAEDVDVSLLDASRPHAALSAGRVGAVRHHPRPLHRRPSVRGAPAGDPPGHAAAARRSRPTQIQQSLRGGASTGSTSAWPWATWTGAAPGGPGGERREDRLLRAHRRRARAPAQPRRWCSTMQRAAARGRRHGRPPPSSAPS